MATYAAFVLCLFYVFGMSAASYLPEVKIRAIVNTHNALRRKVATRWSDRGLSAGNMMKLSWDDDLEVEASGSAECQNVGSTSPDSAASSLSYGEAISFAEDMEYVEHGTNVAVSSVRNIQQMIDEWSSQEVHFDYKYRFCIYGQNCDAFLQMIWADASRIGCSSNRCDVDGEWVNHFVCVYDNRASIFSDPYKIGPLCSGCPVSAGFCEDGLCVPTCHGSSSDNCGCQKTCNHPGIGDGVLHEDTCTCTCLYGMGGDCQDICENPQYYEDEYDVCADLNDPDSCDNMPAYQREFCPANCVYGCRTAL